MNFKNFKKSKNRKEWVAQLSAVTCNNCKKKRGEYGLKPILIT